MCAKSKPPTGLAVRTPEALKALDAWLASLDSATRHRGQTYYEDGHVLAAWADADHYVLAEVEGQEVYCVTLFLTRGKWTSTCTCPMEANCKHAVAAGLAWIANQGADFETEDVRPTEVAEALDDDDLPPRLPAFPVRRPKAAAPKPAAKKISFREQWTPVLAEKLGRPLTEAEGRQLANLSALFTRFTQAQHTLYPQDVLQHGFGGALPPDAQHYTPVFSGWWSHDTAPADPWALWQFLAYSLERNGRELPEAFRPLTDTAAVRTSIDQRLVREELALWRRALDPVAPGYRYERANPVAALAGLRLRLNAHGGFLVEVRPAGAKPWKPASQKIFRDFANAFGGDFEHLPPGERMIGVVLATACRANLYGFGPNLALPADTAGRMLAAPDTHAGLALPNGGPLGFAPEPLVREATVSASSRDRLELRLITPDGRDATTAVKIAAAPAAHYFFEEKVWRGPPTLPATTLPTAALADPAIALRLRATGLRLPASLEIKVRRVTLRPLLRCELHESNDDSGYGYGAESFHAQLLARADDPRCEQHWLGAGGWQWAKGGAPPPRRPDDAMLEFDLGAAQAVAARFADFRLGWMDWKHTWSRAVTKNFPEEFSAWHASLPAGLAIELSPALAGLLGPPLRATMDFSALATDANHDWFDLTVALRVEDTTLTAEEIALLLKARGKWVRLPKGGWRRLELAGAEPDTPAAAALDRLGLTAEDVFASGKPATHRLHALQLASEAAALESRDAKLAAALRERVAGLAALPPPPLPAGLSATLRPYQVEGFHFLAHLSAQGFGGVLADDMGLGKTVQTLAWLLHLHGGSRERERVDSPEVAQASSLPSADAGRMPALPRTPSASPAPPPFRALVVCPKSVVHGWLAETARFAPALAVAAFTPALATSPLSNLEAQLLVTNYTQLRLHAAWFQSAAWDAVVLDEGQFIKNPTSQAAATARALPSRHRLVLTGTPVENRLTDLWSLFAFAQPGLLGPQAAFRRQYDEKEPAALSRLHRRVHHFLLRRTKAQAAPDLPPRTEDEIVVELEPAQRKLYDAELKRARAQLLGLETARALDKVRFNILASLLRLRQICCHPALVDAAHAELPSAKLDALLERLDELHEEGHQVLVFSQFVEMLEIIRTRLAAANIGHLLLTGKTENRAELVAEFQRDKTKTVFLLSLKAAGFGLNLTAASYAILYDPWWNPAVEAQAIDRTHRIGQTRPVIAYRLLAADTVEQKIRALQKEKAALAAAVVQEESLAKVLDLDSLRKILA